MQIVWRTTYHQLKRVAQDVLLYNVRGVIELLNQVQDNGFIGDLTLTHGDLTNGRSQDFGFTGIQVTRAHKVLEDNVSG